MGRLIGPHFGRRPNGMSKSLARVSRTKKEKEHFIRRFIARAVLKGRGLLEKARQKSARVSPRGRIYVLHRNIGARASFVLSRCLAPTRWRVMRILSFSLFLKWAGRLWEFGTYACLHTPRVLHGPRRARGRSLRCLEEEPARGMKEDSRRREGCRRIGGDAGERRHDRTYACPPRPP